jgi:hypothetical protein
MLQLAATKTTGRMNRNRMCVHSREVESSPGGIVPPPNGFPGVIS